MLNTLIEGVSGAKVVIDDEFENLKRRGEEEGDYGDEDNDNDDGINVIEKDLDNWFWWDIKQIHFSIAYMWLEVVSIKGSGLY